MKTIVEQDYSICTPFKPGTKISFIDTSKDDEICIVRVIN